MNHQSLRTEVGRKQSRSGVCPARFFAMIAVPLLGACAIIPGPTGSGTGSASEFNRVTIGDDAERSGEQAQAVEGVRKVLVQRGFEVVADADFRVDVGLAKRAVEVGFRGERGTGNGSASVEALPEDRRLDLCREHIFRLSVAIMDRRKGTVVYRGTAEDVRCGAPDADNLLGLANVALRSLQ